MTALILAVLSASVLGSLHCAGMCGAFVAFAVTGGQAGPRERWRLHAAYNLGRLVVYTALGAVAGTVGAAVNIGGELVGLQRAAAVVAGAMMVCVGLITVARLAGIRLPTPQAPAWMARAAGRGHVSASRLPATARAVVTGLLTTLLPCGWLYAFVITAAGTAHAGLGALTMAAFWVGTLPVMIAVGLAAQRLSGGLGRLLPMVTALVVIVVGLVTVVQRASIGQMRVRPPAPSDSLVERVRSLPAEEMPCCHGDD